MHHKKFFAIQMNQYIYGEKDQRMKNANAHYFVLFQNPRNRQVAEFMTRMVPKGQGSVIHKVLQDIPTKYGYLFVDFTAECEDAYRLRTHIFQEPMTVFKLHHERGLHKMDYSRMVVVPEHKYHAEQQHGGKIHPIVQHMMKEKQEENQVKSMVFPQKSYIEQLAKSIVQTTPSIENMNHYNLRLTAFDNLRRKFFRIPTEKQPIQTQTDPIQTRDMETATRQIQTRDVESSTGRWRKSRSDITPNARALGKTRLPVKKYRFDKENRFPEY